MRARPHASASWLVLGCLATLAIPSGLIAAPLSREDLLRMVDAGVSEETLLAMVERECIDFDPGPEVVIELTGRLPDPVIRAAIRCRPPTEAESAPPSAQAVAPPRDPSPDTPPPTALKDLPARFFERVRPTGYGLFRDVCYGALEIGPRGVEFRCYEDARFDEEVDLAWNEIASICLRQKGKDVVEIVSRSGEERGLWFTTGGQRWDDPGAERLRRIEVERFRGFLPEIREAVPEIGVPERCPE